MKRLITAAVLMIIAISVCIGECVFMKHSFGRINEEIDTIQMYYDEKDPAVETAISDLGDRWDKYAKGLSLFIDHESIDSISGVLATLPVDCRLDEHRFRSSVETLRFMLRELYDTERVSMDGLF